MHARERLIYGLKIGIGLGLISGAISGFLAQMVFSLIVSSSLPNQAPPIVVIILARIIGWSLLGTLIGASYGIKENTSGDLKYGFIGGAIGGAIGGLLFDPLSSAIRIGDGSLGRFAAFSVLGMAIGFTVNHLKDKAVRLNRPEMYRQLTSRLPPNPRLMLPDSGVSKPPFPDR